MALENNGQSKMAREKVTAAEYDIKTAFANYLPKVSATGLYLHNSENINLASEDQRNTLSGMGTSLTSGVQNALMTDPDFLSLYMSDATVKNTVNYMVQKMSAADVEGSLNQIGQELSDDLTLDIQNVYVGMVTVEEPLYVGGKIRAYNKVAAYAKELAETQLSGEDQKVLVTVDEAYWQIVSVANKLRLTNQYVDLLRQMDRNVEIMKQEGVATTSDQLSVRVKLNEAEMSQIKAQNGLALSRMLLCQLCGLPVNEQVVLIDEEKEELETVPAAPQANVEQAMESRPELRILQNMVDLNKQTTNMLKAGNLPQVALMGGYAFSNPNLYNGFQRKFGGVWNIGILVRVPVWNWGDVAYKVRASKGAGAIARLELDEAREKIQLQVNQSTFQVNEANKTLQLAKASVERANENLRTANLGFQEGVISSTTVMEAQTAWLQAASQKIDAEINVKLSEVNLQKALGTLY